MANQWINVAVVGCGRIYEDAHRGAFSNASSKNNIVIGLCDIREDRAKEQLAWLKKAYEKMLKKAKKKEKKEDIERLKHGLDRLEIYTDFTTMLDALEGEVDLIDNCTPGRTHVPLSVQAMEHGYHAMAEKPPALNWWDAKRLVDAEQRTGKCYQLNENVCYERAVRKMREVIAAGKLGTITEIEIHFGHGGPYVPYHFGESGLPHFIDPLWSGGGCLQDLAPHGISRSLWPVGDGCAVTACKTKLLERRQNPRMMSKKPFESKVEDWAEATLEMRDPRTGTTFDMHVVTSWCGGFPFPFSIEGDAGALGIVTNPDTKAYDPVIFKEDGSEEFHPMDKDEWDLHDSYAREIQIFCDNLLHGKPSNTPAVYALRLQETISIQFFSKLQGKEVTLDELDAWGAEMAATHGDDQAIIDAIAVALTGVVDLK